MLFCSQPFLLFFTAVFVVYWALPWHRARVYLLLAASFYFYASWSKWVAGIICVSTTLDYLVGRGMEVSASPRRRRLLLTVSIVANLSLLGYFKYANFFLQSLADALNAAGVHASLPLLQVMLPLGISFYTFEAITYVVDVYRGRLPAERNLAHFMLFILFFPHLLLGPIVRARDFLPQVRRPKRWSWPRLQLGVEYFLLGLFKKLALADRLAAAVDPVFANPTAYSSSATWWAVFAYAIQIYCDFSGYSDMALGCAHMLGYKLAQNFNLPYLSANIAEFWRRWHMSLSGWLRDYLFFPLGGSRCGRWRVRWNLLVTMTLGGLWHGASWTFVLFGALQGTLLIVHRRFHEFCKPRPRLDGALQSLPLLVGRVLVTFLVFCSTLIVFRAASFGVVYRMLGRMVVWRGERAYGLSRNPAPDAALWFAVALMVLGHALAGSGLWRRLAGRLPAPVLGMGYAATLACALVLAPDSGTAFIYFQF